MLRDDITSALKEAMKAGDARRVSTLRLVNAALKNADIEARGQGKGPLGDDDMFGLLQKMIKQRHESVELYDKGGRAELAQQEREGRPPRARREGEKFTTPPPYLPKQLSGDKTRAAISDAIKDTGAAG